MKNLITFALLLMLMSNGHAQESARYVQTPYTEQKVMFDFYFDEPGKIKSALYWIRSLMRPLMEDPYGIAPDDLSIKVIIHGTEIVTLARHNYKKYKDAVERMRYYAEFGVEFKVCGLAMKDYGYRLQDFHEFVEVVPSAITEIAHWQQQGYSVIAPRVMEKRFSIEEIR